MSLYSLEHPSLPVSISDELEAFFHVLLYNGVRFLLHNYPSIVAFVKNYFDGYDEARGRMFSPELKRTIVYQQAELVYCSERLEFLRPDGALHPINLVLSSLLRLFQRRYKYEEYLKQLAVWEAREDRQKLRVEVSYTDHPSSSIRNRPKTPPTLDANGQAVLLEEQSFSFPDRPTKPVLSPTVKRGMESCRSHAVFRALLRMHDDKDGWDFSDKIKEDRLKHYVQDPIVLVKENPMERPSKMSRSDFRMPAIPEHKLDTF